ncbi:regulator of G-protein signaling 13-like isoform X2 [Carassius carassius]|uniref:regulator of G-protein signaling 13-like isoform X2 n=1 Tax=Carassius carassius TaxID=217509 RepID=UPI00286931BC|nr:regulator of G-protein signaling 13-like isoform X2 [Carassius carassius]
MAVDSWAISPRSTMPGLIPQPLPTHLNMDRDDYRRNKTLGKNLMCRLKCLFTSSSAPERLSLEDTQQWSQSLERLLGSKYGLATFRTFLKSEFSDENIEFWLKCEDYKKITSSHKMSSKARKIFEQFVEAESPKEINIDYQTREEIKRKVKSPTPQCFDEAQKIVYGLMERDSYPRFLRSEMYKTLLESFAADNAQT